MARTGRPPSLRELVRAKLIEAGTLGMLSSDMHVSAKSFKQVVKRLRKGGMPVVTLRAGCEPGRFWASPELAFAGGFVGPPKPSSDHLVLVRIAEAGASGIGRRGLEAFGMSERPVRDALERLLAAGTVYRCIGPGSGKPDVYFTSAADRDAYRDAFAAARAPKPKAVREPKPARAPRPVKVKATKPTKEPKPIALPKAKQAAPKQVSFAEVSAINPHGIKPAKVSGFKPRDFSAGAPPLFRSLAFGNYLPGDSAIARAYAPRPFDQPAQRA